MTRAARRDAGGAADALRVVRGNLSGEGMRRWLDAAARGPPEGASALSRWQEGWALPLEDGEDPRVLLGDGDAALWRQRAREFCFGAPAPPPPPLSY